jgi:hypothetical protein
VKDYEQLKEQQFDFPTSWNIISWQNEEKLLFEEIFFDEDGQPKFKYTITIFKSLKFQLVYGTCFFNNSKVSHICKKSTIQRLSDVSNILAFLRSQTSCKKDDQVEQCLQAINNLVEEEVEGSATFQKLQFIKEQFELLFAERSRYSPNFTWTALTWMRTSPSLYRALIQSGLLSLPSIGYLKQISTSFALESGLSSSIKAYLRARIDQLLPEQQTVSLMMDEVKF